MQSIQDEIRSLRGLNSDLHGEISRALHSSILDQERYVERAPSFAHSVHRLTYALRRLDILCETEDSLWFRFSALFRADPCLRLLEELEEDLKQKFQRMTVRGLHQKLKSTSYPLQDVRLIILGAYDARPTDVTLPTAEMSSCQTLEAGATRQPAQLARSTQPGNPLTISDEDEQNARHLIHVIRSRLPEWFPHNRNERSGRNQL